MSEKTFAEWLLAEIEKSGLSNSEIARRAGVSHARISQILGGDPPGKSFLQKIGGVLGKSRSEVFRAAGLIDRLIDEESPSVREMIGKFTRLSDEDQIYMLKIITALDESEQAQKRRSKKPNMKASKS
jgi:transcriptional regulator with XRE-family HTH domain